MLEMTKQNFDELSAVRQTATGKIGTLWCGLMHESPMWPIHGQYQCRTCGRHYPVPWSAGAAKPVLGVRQAGIPSFRSALPLMVIMLALLPASHAQAADAPVVDPTAGPAMAFARYTASLEQASPWSLETIEIEASLPKLEKQGRLRAIRHLLPLGKPEYQVLEIAGDKLVRQQVIIRYLSAEVRAAEIPASSVAITPVNYKFRYKGSVKIGETVAYAFLITPHKKREGLIKGELWLDGETGAVVRESGYFVKKPSIFVKRVEVTRETAVRDGIAEARVTHVSVDTRLVGRAELTIHERPCTDPDRGSTLIIAER
jgi:hypothetical protein